MISYVDSSILLARYLAEDRSDDASELLETAALAATSRITEVEVRRGLALIDRPVERTMSQSLFAQEWRSLAIVELAPALADLAATIATDTRIRSLDAVHVASALVVGAQRFLTFDRRQADAARRLDLGVVGVPG